MLVPMKPIIFALCLLPALVFSAAQKNKTEDPIYPVGKQGVTPPRAIFTPQPEDSRDAREIKSTRIAIISGYVGSDGQFHSAKLLRSTGDSKLDAKALDRLATWKFHPCTKDGKPVNCSMNLEVEFHLYRDPK